MISRVCELLVLAAVGQTATTGTPAAATAVTTPAPAPAPTPAPAVTTCELARIHDLAPLQQAIGQDKQMAASFAATATACAAGGDACDQARLDCGAKLTEIVKAQVTFDDGLWLRDLLLPYMGQTYVPTRQFTAGTVAVDTSCQGDQATLTAAGQRRQQQASKRELLLTEYPLYVKWVSAAQQRCSDAAAVEAARTAQARSEAEKAAAAALAAKTAEEARQKAEQDKKRAEEDAKRQAEKAKADADAKLAKEKADAEQKVKDAQAAAEKKAQDAQDAAKKEAEKAKADAADKAAREEEAKLVAARDEKVSSLRKQKEQIVAEAQAKYDRLAADADTKRKAAAEAVSKDPVTAQPFVTAAAQAEQARDAAKAGLDDAKIKAQAIEVDDSHERSRGSLGLQLGGGAGDWGNGTIGFIGVHGVFHLGLWGTAPSKGLASGLEFRASGSFLQSLTGPNQVEGVLSVMYFIGLFGVGAAGDFQLQPGAGVPANVVRFRGAGGLSLALALVDTPRTRAILRARYAPIGGPMDFTRVSGDFELAHEAFFLSLNGGTFAANAPTPKQAWQAALTAGIRVKW